METGTSMLSNVPDDEMDQDLWDRQEYFATLMIVSLSKFDFYTSIIGRPRSTNAPPKDCGFQVPNFQCFILLLGASSSSLCCAQARASHVWL